MSCLNGWLCGANYSKIVSFKNFDQTVTTEVKEMMGTGQDWQLAHDRVSGEGRQKVAEVTACGPKTPKKHKENKGKTSRRGGGD
jgi:hypothetical protein